MSIGSRLNKLEEMHQPQSIRNYAIIYSPEIEGKKCISYNGERVTPEEYRKQGGDYKWTLKVEYV